MNRLFLTNTTPIKFDFVQSPTSFKVIENINIKLQKKGDYKLLKVTKVEKSTIELLEYISSVLKIKENEIGYAGLKDKHATTTQYLTVPKYVNIKRFKNTDSVQIKELGLCSDRLKIGQLKSNTFEIILENIDEKDYHKLEISYEQIIKYGFANFFGYQRFGVLDDATLKGKKISDFGKGSKNQKSRIILAAYQAKYFNKWLNKRLKISKDIINGIKSKELKSISPTLFNLIKSSKTPFKLLPGDLMMHFKKSKKEYKIANDLQKEIELFDSKKIYPTGALFGNSVRYSVSIAKNIEKEFIDYSFNSLKGARRIAWSFPYNATIKYNSNKRESKLSFTLMPGVYATVLLEELKNGKI